MGQELFVRDSRIICGGQSFYGTDIGSSSTNELYLENNNNRLRWGRGGQLYQSVNSFDVGSTSEPTNSMWTSVEDGIRRLYVARNGRKVTMSHLKFTENRSDSGEFREGNFGGGTRANYYWNPPFPSGFSRLIITEASVYACAGGTSGNKDVSLYVVNDNSTSPKRTILSTSTICSTVSTSGGETSGSPVAYVDAGERLRFTVFVDVVFRGDVDWSFFVKGWYAPSNHYVNAPIFQ